MFAIATTKTQPVLVPDDNNVALPGHEPAAKRGRLEQGRFGEFFRR
jgi:hypothetical protein